MAGNPIWTDDFLNGLAAAAEKQIAIDVPCIFQIFSMPTTTGVSVYTLPSFVKGVRRVTWLGRKVEPLNWEQFVLLTPATVFVGPGNSHNIETSNSRPQWYTQHPTNVKDIRFFPTPDRTFPGTDDPYKPTPTSGCLIAYNSYINNNSPLTSLPSYVDQRTRKAYILWKAFEQEGVGQDMNAAKYYKSLYSFLIEQFNLINDGCFVSKKYSLGDGLFGLENYRYPKPLLPPNYERVIY